MADYEKTYKKALDIFAIDTLPNNMDNIIFSYKWKTQLVKHGFCIKSSIDFVKVFKVDYNLMTLGIQKKILLFLKVILLIVENEDCQRKIDIYQNLISISSKNEDTL